jgi:dienelactone hydrolase
MRFALFAAAAISFMAVEPGTPQSAQPGFGPPAPDFDLRTMLRNHVFRRSAELLRVAAARREQAVRSQAIGPFRDEIRRGLREALGDMPFAGGGAALNVRVVSRHQRKQYRIENVLFESLPGWDVNATVYLPRVEDCPPPWPAIIVPVGHSGKQFSAYQIPPQVFANACYLSLTFDPPGQAGEKQPGNDHFRDGVRAYLTGSTSQRYFVLDALRAIDYLETRRDVDMSHGVGMTGVSGGGFTTLYATLLDKRIKAAGPSCFSAPELEHPLGDGYPPCPETLAFGVYPRGLDPVSLLVATSPTPLLMMAGRDDEVFKAAWMRQMADQAAQGYAAAGAAEKFRFFLDASGHDYTIAQALEFIRWMDRWVRGTPERALPDVTAAEVEMAPYDVLRCYPRPAENMLTMARREMAGLESKRAGLDVRAAAAEIARVGGRAPAVYAGGVKRSKPFLVWGDYLEELLLATDNDIQLPATFLYDAKSTTPGGAILYFDDRGRWQELASGGQLASLSRFTERESGKPGLLTVDLRGWGDTRPAFAPYDAAGWASPQRSLAYVSAALGDPVLAMRIRDGLATLGYLRSRTEVDPGRIVVGGHGMGGVVALHVAAIDGRVRGAFADNGPASFALLGAADNYTWEHDAFLPGVLRYYDLPELAGAIGAPVLILNPLDAKKAPLSAEAAAGLYRPANKGVDVRVDADRSAARQAVRKWVEDRLR